MEELKKELIELGYVDKVSKGSEGYSENMRDYAFIQLPKKGNSDLIKKLIEHGWKKKGNLSFAHHLKLVIVDTVFI